MVLSSRSSDFCGAQTALNCARERVEKPQLDFELQKKIGQIIKFFLVSEGP